VREASNNGDFSVMGESWLNSRLDIPADLNRDVTVDMFDLADIANEWMTGGNGFFHVSKADIVFQDDFEQGGSPLWGNESGGWQVIDGMYSASQPDNLPPTYTSLPFSNGDFAVQLDIKSVSDGGIWLRSHIEDGKKTGVLLVTGGFGGKGTGFYWLTLHSDSYSSALNKINDLFAQGDDIHLRIEVVGNTYSAYFNNDPNPVTFLQTDVFNAGNSALYSFSNQQFDNVEVRE